MIPGPGRARPETTTAARVSIMRPSIVEAGGLADSVLHSVTPPGIWPTVARVIELDREVRDVRPGVADHEVEVPRGIAPLLTGDDRRPPPHYLAELDPGKISEPSCAKTSSSTALARRSADVSSGLPQYAPSEDDRPRSRAEATLVPLARSPCRRAIRSLRLHPPASRTRVLWRTGKRAGAGPCLSRAATAAEPGRVYGRSTAGTSRVHPPATSSRPPSRPPSPEARAPPSHTCPTTPMPPT
jgi:hypothetical protein